MKKYQVVVVAALTLLSLQGCSKQAKHDPVEEADEIIGDIEGTQTGATGMINGQVQAAVPGQTKRDIIAQSYTATTPVVDPTAVTAVAVEPQEYEKPTTQSIQEALKNAGVYTGPVDGVLGPKTKRAIREFQSMNSLSADGKVGHKTWSKLKPYLSGVPAAPVPESPVVTGVSN